MNTKIVMSILTAIMAVTLLISCKHPGVTQSNASEQEIARACLQVLHSPLVDQPDIDPADKRLPEAIRQLHPGHIEIEAGMVVLSFPLHNGLTEYHLSPVSSQPGTWLLYGAGPKYDNQHRELLRFQDR